MAATKRTSKAKELKEKLYHGLILDAAEQEFAEHGFELARVQRVADAAGLSVGTLYKLFASKDALFEGMRQRRGEEFARRIVVALSAPGDPLQRLERAVQAYVAYSVEHPAFLKVQLKGGISWSSTPDHLPAEALKTWRSAINAGVSMCKAGIKDGVLVAEDPLRMVRTLAGIHQAHMAHWLEDGMREPAEVVSARLAETFSRLYRARA